MGYMPVRADGCRLFLLSVRGCLWRRIAARPRKYESSLAEASQIPAGIAYKQRHFVCLSPNEQVVSRFDRQMFLPVYGDENLIDALYGFEAYAGG